MVVVAVVVVAVVVVVVVVVVGWARCGRGVKRGREKCEGMKFCQRLTRSRSPRFLLPLLLLPLVASNCFSAPAFVSESYLFHR